MQFPPKSRMTPPPTREKTFHTHTNGILRGTTGTAPPESIVPSEGTIITSEETFFSSEGKFISSEETIITWEETKIIGGKKGKKVFKRFSKGLQGLQKKKPKTLTAGNAGIIGSSP